MNTDSTETRVGEAGHADLAACARLQTLHSGGDSEEAAHRLRRELDRPDRLLLVARTGDGAGPIVGYGRLTRFTSGGAEGEAPGGHYLGGLVVSPAHRGRGIGTALTRARMRTAFVHHGAGTVWYVANARNKASIALHARLGFHEVTRAFWYPGVTFAGGAGVLFRALASGRGPESDH